jgi:UPF0271 protein
MKKALILDSSALIGGVRPYQEECFTVKEVLKEIKNRNTKLRVDVSIREGSLKILKPSKECCEEVKRVALNSGDIALLSKTDIKVLALARHLLRLGRKVTIITDDYDIQNMASIMDIEFKPITEMGIKKVFRWKTICKGCGKKFPASYKGRCDVCGSELKIVRG